MLSKRFVALNLALAASGAAASANAHIRLDYPTARYPAPSIEQGQQLKQSPCGVTGDARTTDASRITQFKPGEKITVKWHESINHPGHYRIAFDPNGQSALVDPASYTDIQTAPPVLLDNIADRPDQTYAVEITLPNIECTHCTLQVIQLMTDKPPYVINTDDVYHQCADLVLKADAGGAGGASAGGTGGSGGVSNGAGSGGASAGNGFGGVSGTATGAAGMATSAGGASAGSGGGQLIDNGAVNNDSSGCALGSSRPAASGIGALFLLLCAGIARRRRAS